MKKVFTVAERLNRLEIAQETLGFLMAERTANIQEEKQKPEPDAGQITTWTTEFDCLHDELDNLRMDDDAGVERVLAQYCPQVKNRYERRYNQGLQAIA